jgi:hypothetical protein
MAISADALLARVVDVRGGHPGQSAELVLDVLDAGCRAEAGAPLRQEASPTITRCPVRSRSSPSTTSCRSPAHTSGAASPIAAQPTLTSPSASNNHLLPLSSRWTRLDRLARETVGGRHPSPLCGGHPSRRDQCWLAAGGWTAPPGGRASRHADEKSPVVGSSRLRPSRVEPSTFCGFAGAPSSDNQKSPANERVLEVLCQLGRRRVSNDADALTTDHTEKTCKL